MLEARSLPVRCHPVAPGTHGGDEEVLAPTESGLSEVSMMFGSYLCYDDMDLSWMMAKDCAYGTDQ